MPPNGIKSMKMKKQKKVMTFQQLAFNYSNNTKSSNENSIIIIHKRVPQKCQVSVNVLYWYCFHCYFLCCCYNWMPTVGRS